MKCGLLGQKLGHSYSPQIHSYLGDYDYQLFEKEPAELESFLKSGEFHGLNVTIPYKKAVIPYCDELSPIAAKLGAVNTIVRLPNGKLKGHNTDFFGFSFMLKECGADISGKKVLVLGSGGASNTVVSVLTDSGAEAIVISRSGKNNYNNLHLHTDAAAIVNTTPVGMYPNTGVSPIDLRLFPRLVCVLDVVYNPAKTQLLLDAESRGLPTMNGLRMLVAQAKESAEWFTGKSISDDIIAKIHRRLRLQMENIILIGMPGCGKTTIGQELSLRLNKPFVDIDAKIVETTGFSIPEIFSQQGEYGFRKIETDVLAQYCKGSGQIIATGGGCVTRACNYALLHQNGFVIYLKRDIAMLPKDGRPLSQTDDIEEMFIRRKPLYESFCHVSFDNNSSTSQTVADILNTEVFNEYSCD